MAREQGKAQGIVFGGLRHEPMSLQFGVGDVLGLGEAAKEGSAAHHITSKQAREMVPCFSCHHHPRLPGALGHSLRSSKQGATRCYDDTACLLQQCAHSLSVDAVLAVHVPRDRIAGGTCSALHAGPHLPKHARRTSTRQGHAEKELIAGKHAGLHSS